MQARDLRMDQDIVFVEPLKKYGYGVSVCVCVYVCVCGVVFIRLKEVVKKMDLYSKQREQKLQVINH